MQPFENQKPKILGPNEEPLNEYLTRLLNTEEKDIEAFHADIHWLHNYYGWTLCIDTQKWTYTVRPTTKKPEKVRKLYDNKESTATEVIGVGRNRSVRHIGRVKEDFRNDLKTGLFSISECLNILQQMKNKSFNPDSKRIGGIDQQFHQAYFVWSDKGVLMCDQDMKSYPREVINHYLL